MERHPWNWDRVGRGQGLCRKGQDSDSNTDMDKFDCDWTAPDQGNFDIKMMTFLCFEDGVTPQDPNCVQLDLQQA